jgi:membrane-associated protease RseP (regulator of RpoE activity)
MMSDPSTPLTRPIEPVRLQGVVTAAQSRHRRYWLHAVFLVLTLFTTLIVGAHLQYNFDHNLPAFTTESYRVPELLTSRVFRSAEPMFVELPFPMKFVWQQPQRLLLGIPFAVTLLCILLAHELGHFVYCERYGVYATLPYFLPGPFISPIGTFGAVIRIKSPIRTRQALFDIGIAGPIAGFVVAVPVLLCGLTLSKPILAQASGSLINFGFPLIFHLSHGVIRLVLPNTPALGSIYLHPVGVAAWVGMLATALNLLPGGQLDGGHLVYAFAPRAHKWVTTTTVAVLALLSAFWVGWLVWALILGLIGRRHPPVAPWPELSKGRRAWSVVAVALLALTWTPAPILGQGWF